MSKNEHPMNQIFGKNFESYFGQFPSSQFDLKSLMDTQRKNSEAINEALKVAGDGFQAYTRKCAEVMSQFVEEQSNITRELMKDGAPEEKISRQADLIQKNYEKSVGTAKELANLISESNQQATDVINNRIRDSLKEVRHALANKNDNTTQKKAS